MKGIILAGGLDNLKEIASHPRYAFVKGDICHRELVESVFCEFDIKGVIHFAAESHVDNSIQAPGDFIHTNVFGTFNVLDVARNYWTLAPNRYRPGYGECRFHHISTDEVYGSLADTGLFTEEHRYAPNNPYSASKAGSDMIVKSYHSTYGLNVVISNCSNNYGPGQHDEKFIPTVVRKALALEMIPVYGGGRNEQENIEVAQKICEILDRTAPQLKEGSAISSYRDLIHFVPDRPGHDKRYAIDPAKIENELGWQAGEDFENGLYQTVMWYLRKYEGGNKNPS